MAVMNPLDGLLTLDVPSWPESAAAASPSPLGSLVARSGLYRRNGIAWASCRTWRRNAKTADIAILRAAKAELDPGIIAAAADELAELARALLGRPAAHWCVSTVAVWHSRRPDSLPVRVARGVAERLQLSFVRLFADRFVSGSSHPRQHDRLPPVTWLAAPPGPVLLVDDVATSGWHIEEALTAIRARDIPALAVVWISGTVR